jgi:raffinose/stachyose/melibiose transport system substrate-binding protein
MFPLHKVLSSKHLMMTGGQHVNKKTFITTTFLLTSTLVGCGGGSTTQLRIINFRPEDQEFYIWLEREFEKEYPNINVVYEAVDTGGYTAFMKARIQSGEVDIFGSQPAFVNTAKTFEDSLDLRDLTFWDRIVDSAKSEVTISTGEILMTPLSYHTEIVFYNKNIFSAQGWSVPTTWNEFQTLLNAARAATTATQIKAPIIYGGLDVWPIAMVTEALAGTTILQDDPDFLLNITEAYRQHAITGITTDDMYFVNNPFFNDFFEKYKVITQYFQRNASGLQYSRAPGEFGKGGYAMTIDGSWSLSQILEMQPDFEIGAFPLPGNSDPTKNQIAAGKGAAAFSIYKNSTRVTEAKLFLEFLYRNEIYSEYINAVLGSPVVKGIELENELAREIFRFDTVLTISNQWVEKMPYDLIMKQDAGPGFINNSMTVTQALTLIDNDVYNQRAIWLPNVQKWIDKFHPNYQS